MSGCVRTLLLNLIILLLFCINNSRAQQSFCSTSCCECILGGQEIQCDGFKSYPEFICDVPQVLDKLQLYNIDKPEIKTNFEKVTEIEYLIIRNSPIVILTDIINGKKSLKRLKLIDVRVVNDWKWSSIFLQFNKLTDFNLENTKLPSDQLIIDGNADQMVSNKMISFSVKNCGIQSIKSNIIKEWVHLKMISLAHNCFERLDREWLPSRLGSLWSLDLSHNNIESIPENYFTGMTALRKLRLDYNSFKTLHEIWFPHNILEGLHELWIDHNQIECDPNLSWIPNATHPTFFDEGSCNSNVTGKIMARYFHQLRNEDMDIYTKH